MTVFVRDLIERVLATFLVTFLGALITSGWFDLHGITDVSILGKAALAGVAAVLSLAKGLAAKYVGDSDSASLSKRVGAQLRSRF